MMRLGALLALCGATLCAAQAPSGPVVVRFHEPRVDGTPSVAAIDPEVRIRIASTGRMVFGLQVLPGITLTTGSSIRTSFRMDERMLLPLTGPAGPLPLGPGGKRRNGGQSTWTSDDVHFRQVLEVVPSKAGPGALRQLDAVLVHYAIENRARVPHKIGARVRIDTMCAGNDGALFAAPMTHPGKVLDGVELRDRTLPDFVQILQRPNLDNPGFVGHFALKLGSRLIGPDRFLCTAHGAFDNGWNVAVQPANGDSDCVLYWEPRTIAPGGRLDLGFGYGKGIATLPEGEGRLSLQLGGSFEPGKLFTLAAYVDDPNPNQTLALELPASLQLAEGKAIQPVPPAAGSGTSLVLWKARVRALGTHAVTVRSSNGVAETRSFTVSRAN